MKKVIAVLIALGMILSAAKPFSVIIIGNILIGLMSMMN